MSGAPITKALTTTDGRVLIEQPDGTYRPAASQTDWARLDAMTEEEEERLAAEDMAELGMDPDWMEQAKVGFACSALYLDHVDAVNLTPDQQAFMKEVPDPMYMPTPH